MKQQDLQRGASSICKRLHKLLIPREEKYKKSMEIKDSFESAMANLYNNCQMDSKSRLEVETERADLQFKIKNMPGLTTSGTSHAEASKGNSMDLLGLIPSVSEAIHTGIVASTGFCTGKLRGKVQS